MNAARSAFLLGFVLALSACDAPLEDSVEEASVPSPRPSEVPTPDLTDMEPRVRALIIDTRRRVLERLDSAEVWGHYAMALDAHEVHREAVAAYRTARLLDPTEFRWAYLYAHVLQLQELEEIDVAMVEAAFRAAERVRGDYAPLHVRLGEVLTEVGDLEGARAAYARAVELDATNPSAHCGLARTLLSLGDASAALDAVRPVLAANPDRWEAQMILARVRARLGDRDQARVAAARARTLPQVADVEDPMVGQMMTYALSATACFKRSQALYQSGEYRQAILNLKVVSEIRPDYAPVYERLGWCFLKSGKAEKALKNFERALELESGEPGLRTGLARALEALGRPEEAAAHLKVGEQLAAASAN